MNKWPIFKKNLPRSFIAKIPFYFGGVLGPLYSIIVYTTKTRLSPLLLLFFLVSFGPNFGQGGQDFPPLDKAHLVPQLMGNSGPAVGFIRFDVWFGDNHFENLLNPAEFHDRVPFFGKILGPNEVEIRANRQSVIDQETAYALHSNFAGDKYWLFALYPDLPPDAYGFPYRMMNQSLELYLSSERKREMNFCLQGGGMVMDEWTLAWQMPLVLKLLKEPTYQKVLGNRPIFYMFDDFDLPQKYGSWKDVRARVNRFRQKVIADGNANPYLVAMVFHPERGADYVNFGGFDAISSYAVGPERPAEPFSTLASRTLQFNEAVRLTGKPEVPIQMTRFSPEPHRGDIYYPYNGNYSIQPTALEFENHTRDIVEFVNQNPTAVETNHFVVYAWNENAEGGILQPTLHEGPLLLDALTKTLTEGESSLMVTRHPDSKTVAEGAEVGLHASVRGRGPFHFQWYKNDQPMNGETNATLYTRPVSLSDNKVVFYCEISNDLQEKVATGRATLTVISEPAPSVLRVVPNVGSITGGLRIVITGSNFRNTLGVPTVKFGNWMATDVHFVSSTQLVATTPFGYVGQTSVKVVNADGSTGELIDGFTYMAPDGVAPKVTSANPQSGPASGGTVVTLTGTDFRPGAMVTFGDVLAADPTYISETELRVITPAHSAGGVEIRVINSDLTSGAFAGEFSFIGTPLNAAPKVSAGPDQVIILPAQANLDGTVQDDGLPNPPGRVTSTWSRVSGPGTATFGDENSIDTTVSFTASGLYVLKLTAFDGILSSQDEIRITVNPMPPPPNGRPIADAGANQTIALPSVAQIRGHVQDDGLPNPPGRVTTLWMKSAGPGTVLFEDAGALATTARFSEPGHYVLTFRANDNQLSANSNVTIIVNPASETSLDQPRQTITIAPNPMDSTVTFSGLGADATIEILDRRGKKVKDIEATGTFVKWDGRDDSGNRLSNGIYVCVIKGSGARSVVKLGILR